MLQQACGGCKKCYIEGAAMVGFQETCYEDI